MKQTLPASAKGKLAARLGSTPLHTKIHRLLRKAFGARAERLLFFDNNSEAAQAVRAAYHRRIRKEKAADLAFHLLDWREEGAFLIALNLFPEKFSPEEIRDGILGFVCHAPYHVNGVSKALDFEISVPEDDEPKSKRKRKAKRA